MRRPLAETFLELVGAAHTFEGPAASFYITGLAVDVPIEIRLRRADEGWELLADLPQWRWQTGLEELPGRLRLSWEGISP